MNRDPSIFSDGRDPVMHAKLGDDDIYIDAWLFQVLANEFKADLLEACTDMVHAYMDGLQAGKSQEAIALELKAYIDRKAIDILVPPLTYATYIRDMVAQGKAGVIELGNLTGKKSPIGEMTGRMNDRLDDGPIFNIVRPED